MKLVTHVVFAGILDDSHPFVPALNLDIRHLSRCFSFKCIMVSKIIVIKLVTFKDWRIRLFDAAHDFFAVSYFTVKSFHLVVIVVALNVDMSNVGSTRRNSTPKLFFVRFMKVGGSITNENVWLFTRDFLSLFEHWPH